MTSAQEKVLIVDDEEAIRKLLNRHLSTEGYLCQEASSADDALSKIKSVQPTLVILDINMPGKLGTELLTEIKASYPDTLVIMATAVSDTRIAVECMKRGADDYFTKPFSLDEVSLSIYRAQKKKERHPGNNGNSQQPVPAKVECQTATIAKGDTSQIDKLLKLTVEKKASDLHLKSSLPPVLRIDGELVTQEKLPPISAEELEAIFASMTTPEQQKVFARDLELDFIYSVPDLARFRVSAARQKGTISLALRLVPFKVYPIEVLGLPLILKDLALKPRGLILVTGTTGSGKSTTLAAMINHLNENEKRHVLTIEDPIEFLHEGKKGIIAQRDLAGDTKSFSAALIHALRHDPDVIVVGEMRDLETISTAITAAETGHLVMSTLHTTSAAQTIDRIIDVFPPNQQAMVKVQLSQVLEAVISQVLLRRVGGGRIAALEILIATAAVRNLIREGKNFQLPSVMQLGSKDHMQTLNQALAELVRKKIVTEAEALSKSSDPEQLRKLIQAPANTV